MRSPGCLLRWVAVFSTVLWTSGASAQQAPIEAQLSQPLSGDKLRIGSYFTLQVVVPWQQAECRLAPGALLHATVEATTQKDHHTRAITFLVEAPCGEKNPLKPVLTSLLASPQIEEETDQFPGFFSNGGVNQPNPMSATLNPLDVAKPASFAIRHTTIKNSDLPKTVTLGEVWRLPHVKLVLPAGNSTEATIETEKSSLALPARTIFILQIPQPGDRSLHTLPAVATSSIRAGPPPPGPFLGPCQAHLCTTDPAPLTTHPFGFQRTGAPEDLAQLGMRHESEREVLHLQQDTTVHFVGNRKVLVTFPSHELLRHTAEERPTDNPQQIRAVLFDVVTRSVDRVEQWIIDDHNAYIWPFGQDLLVHEGRSLKKYGPDLQELASLSLDMPLASLRASPDGEHLLIGELRELHSREDHSMLVDTLARGPQEEVRWSLLDHDLQRIRMLGTSSNFVPTPVLLNESMIDLRRGVASEYFFIAKAWNSNRDKQLGSLRSACSPLLDNISPDLLVATICDTSGKATQTALVRENGSPVIEQISTIQDLPASAAGSNSSTRVALMLTRLQSDWSQGHLFRFDMIKEQRIEVFATDDGSLLASIPLPGTEHSSNAFALSPDGSMLAVVAGRHLSFYEIQH